MKVVILHDALPAEPSSDHLDVLVQADAVSEALRGLGHRPLIAPFSLNLKAASDELVRLGPDLVFNLVESVGGRGRLIYLAPALLDALAIPYTGAGTEAMFQTSQKVLAKQRLRGRGISTPNWYSHDELASGPVEPGRYIIKSVWEDASIGLAEDSVAWIDCADDLRERIESRLEILGGDGFAEAYIEGREFNLALLGGPDGPQVLHPAEIEFVDYAEGRPRIVDYRAKWDTDSFEYQHTVHCFDFPESDRPLVERLSGIAAECWELFALRGYARVDFRVDSVGRPWVLEINANPCLSPDAGFTAALGRSGLSFIEAVERIIQDAQQRPTHARPPADAIAR